MTTSTILVTGSTGFVGQEVVRELLAEGHAVRLLVRDPRRAAMFAGQAGVEIVSGDVLLPETLPQALAGVRTVIHLVGIIKETSKVTFEQAHTEATRNLLAAARQASVTRWIQMSALGTRPGAVSRYHRSKWEAEELVRQSGLAWTIFRPSLIYGYDKRDRLLNLFRRLLSFPWRALLFFSLPLLDGGRARVQPVSVREVAYCFARAVPTEASANLPFDPVVLAVRQQLRLKLMGASVNRTFDLVGPVAFSWREMVGKIAANRGESLVDEVDPLRLAYRLIIRIFCELGPLIMILIWSAHLISFPVSVALFFVAVLFSFVAAERSWQLNISNLPSAPLLALAGWLNPILPRTLQFGEQLKMAREDNIGDFRPAAETFRYTPETFVAGLTMLRPS